MPSQILHPVPRRNSPLLTSALQATSRESHNYFTATLSIKTQQPYKFVSRQEHEEDHDNDFHCPPAPPSSPVNFGRRSGDEANMSGSWTSDSGSESDKSSA